MDNKYKVLKKFGDLKKGATFVPGDETEEEIAEAVAEGYIELITDDSADSKKGPGKKGEVSKVTFSVRNPDVKGGVSERVFTAEEHGEEFVAVADEFGETNKSTVLSRKDE